MADVTVQFRPDMSGIREILHSDGVHDELWDILDGMNEDANGEFYNHFWGAMTDGYNVDIDEGRYTSLGVVYTQTALGMLDEAKYHTLESLNH